jgi:hypothetical protein
MYLPLLSPMLGHALCLGSMPNRTVRFLARTVAGKEEEGEEGEEEVQPAEGKKRGRQRGLVTRSMEGAGVGLLSLRAGENGHWRGQRRGASRVRGREILWSRWISRGAMRHRPRRTSALTLVKPRRSLWEEAARSAVLSTPASMQVR